MNKKISIIYFPMIAWSWMKQRPQHIMSSFAKLGYTCAYITPQNRGVIEVVGNKEIEPNLFLCQNEEEMAKVIKGSDEIWIYTTWFMHQIYKQKHPDFKVIYDIVDHVPFLSNYKGIGEIYHKHLIEQSEIIICTAENLYNKVKDERKDVIYIPNGVVVEDFSENKFTKMKDIENIINKGKPIVGYYGALAHWFDWELFNKVAESRQEYNFVLIGCDYDGSINKHLIKRNNVFYLGLKSYEDLVSYSKCFDVATVPFKINDITDACSPVKIFEYMAAGIPILSTPLKECKKYKLVNIADDIYDYLKNLDYIIDSMEKEVTKDELIECAIENSWESRVKQIIEKMEI